eukprot:2677489-Rhodomonas_salina.2
MHDHSSPRMCPQHRWRRRGREGRGREELPGLLCAKRATRLRKRLFESAVTETVSNTKIGPLPRSSLRVAHRTSRVARQFWWDNDQGYCGVERDVSAACDDMHLKRSSESRSGRMTSTKWVSSLMLLVVSLAASQASQNPTVGDRTAEPGAGGKQSEAQLQPVHQVGHRAAHELCDAQD